MFDASSIFRAIRENAVEVLAGNLTLGLARYELGNILWKECILRNAINGEEAKKLIGFIGKALDVMEVVDINGHEDGILSTAIDLELTFYDASYVYLAKKRGMPLVTEDERLSNKVKAHLKVLNLDGLGV